MAVVVAVVVAVAADYVSVAVVADGAVAGDLLHTPKQSLYLYCRALTALHCRAT